MEKTHEVTKPHNECPRYQNCNINNCPLHPLYPDLYIDMDDANKKCTMEKSVRFRIGSQYPEVLKWQGLTSREWIGKVKWESLTEEERQNVIKTTKERFSIACEN